MEHYKDRIRVFGPYNTGNPPLSEVDSTNTGMDYAYNKAALTIHLERKGDGMTGTARIRPISNKDIDVVPMIYKDKRVMGKTLQQIKDLPVLK